MFEERTYTVSEFNRKVKDYLEENSDLREFFLEGELSGVTYYKSGPTDSSVTYKDKSCYSFRLSLKDEKPLSE